jgi:ActR/RegA family two-component response regulator
MQNGLARVLCFDETDFDGVYDDYQEFRPDLVVEHVVTADEGFKRLRTRNYEFVIADMLMSPVSGLEMFKILKNILPKN